MQYSRAVARPISVICRGTGELLRKLLSDVELLMRCRCTRHGEDRLADVRLHGCRCVAAVVISTLCQSQLSVTATCRPRRGPGARRRRLLGGHCHLCQTLAASSCLLRTILHDVLLHVLHAARLPRLRCLSTRRRSLQSFTPWTHQVSQHSTVYTFIRFKWTHPPTTVRTPNVVSLKQPTPTSIRSTTRSTLRFVHVNLAGSDPQRVTVIVIWYKIGNLSLWWIFLWTRKNTPFRSALKVAA